MTKNNGRNDILLNNPIIAKKPATPAQRDAAQGSTPRAVDPQTQLFLNGLKNGSLSDQIPDVYAEKTDASNVWSGENSIFRLFRNNAVGFSNPVPSLQSYASLRAKDVLTQDDVTMADTSDKNVSNMPVYVVPGKKGHSDSIYTDSGFEKFAASRPNLPRYEETTVGTLQYRSISSTLDRADAAVSVGTSTALNPKLVEKMARNPRIAHYVDVAQKEAAKVGIDGNMFANQLWQESSFNPKAISSEGARGIAQMMPGTGRKYGLKSDSDFTNPEKSIHAGALMMAQMTEKYGDQRLALVAYNGGGKAIDFVEKSLHKDDISYDEWHDFMTARHNKLGSAQKSAWHNETRRYVEAIVQQPSPVLTAEYRARIPAPEPS